MVEGAVDGRQQRDAMPAKWVISMRSTDTEESAHNANYQLETPF